MDKETIMAMAIAAVAEELNIEFHRIKVLSFKEVEKSSLEKYIEENQISFKKYRLGDIT